jgi:hypothetical protein
MPSKAPYKFQIPFLKYVYIFIQGDKIFSLYKSSRPEDQL